jgi:hypothetical protein
MSLERGVVVCACGGWMNLCVSCECFTIYFTTIIYPTLESKVLGLYFLMGEVEASEQRGQSNNEVFPLSKARDLAFT